MFEYLHEAAVDRGLFPFRSQAFIIDLLADGGDRLRQETLTTVVMHAGLPYAAR